MVYSKLKESFERFQATLLLPMAGHHHPIGPGLSVGHLCQGIPAPKPGQATLLLKLERGWSATAEHADLINTLNSILRAVGTVLGVISIAVA